MSNSVQQSGLTLCFSNKKHDIKTLLGIITGYLLLSQWASKLVLGSDPYSLMWLPDGFLLGCLLLLEKRLWLPLLITLSPLHVALEQLSLERPFGMSLLYLLSNTIESFGGALFFTRFARNRGTFTEFSDLAIFLLACCLLFPAISALVGAFAVTNYGYSDDFLSVYRTWFMSDTLGMLFIAPLVIYIVDQIKTQAYKDLSQLPLYISALASALLLVLSTLLLDSQSTDHIIKLALLPALIYLALRYGIWGALLYSTIIVICVTHLAIFGFGFVDQANQNAADAIFELQSYLATSIVAALFTGIAVEKLRDTQSTLTENEKRLSLILDTAPYGIQELNISGEVTYSNPALADIMDTSPDSLIGKKVWDLGFSVNDRSLLEENYYALLLEQTAPAPFVMKYRQASGQELWLEAIWNYKRNDSGDIVGLISIVADISDKLEANRLLSQSAEIIQNTSEGIIITDSNKTIVDVNPAFSSITGYSAEEAIGNTPELLKSNQHEPAFYQRMWHAIHTTDHWKGEIQNRKKNGVIYPQSLAIRSLRDEAGSLTGYVATISDLSNIKSYEQQLDFLAYHDVLTNLPNKYLLIERLTLNVQHAKRAGESIAVIRLGLDRFKSVNEAFGNSYGDRVLQDLAARLKSHIRESDTIARLSGDEFIIVLDDISEPLDAARFLEHLSPVLKKPYQLAGHNITITASFGIALFPNDTDSAENLLRYSSSALDIAKQSGRNTFEFYKQEMQSSSQAYLLLEHDMRNALTNNEFFLVYQPQYDLASKALIGVEALIRWQHPTQGLISPGKFIPIAEHSGLIQEIGDWVLDEAISQIAQWNRAGTPVNKVSINVVEPQLKREDFCSKLFERMAANAVPSSQIELEVTENFLMGESYDAIANLQKCRKSGITVAIDDFGTGYSSLSYLKTLPVDKLKIDQSFIREIPEDQSSGAITEAIINIGKTLGLSVIAEGVETQKQAEFIQIKGCDSAQGYLFSKPISHSELETLIEV